MTTPLAEGPDLLSLAYEIQASDRTLSLDQALDAAALVQTELADYAAAWEVEIAAQWIALQVYARDWNASARPPGRS